MKTACDCDSPANYAESVEVIWHKPSEYSMERHGPPYLPSGCTKLSSDQKASVKAFVKTAGVSVQATVKQVLASDPSVTPLTVLVGYLQAISLLHRTHHWNTTGAEFYGDHLLFERVYNESSADIDSLAERAVGKGCPQMIDPLSQSRMTCGALKGLKNRYPDAGYVELSLQAEVCCLKLIDAVMAKLKAVGQLSSGDSNLLEGVADKHEVLVYLLKQRFSGTPESKPRMEVYAYDRS
jgi:hypothetical protein